MPTIDSRRDISTSPRTSPGARVPPCLSVSQSGVTIWFDTIVARAIAATITIDVAEEKPPRKASMASFSCPCDSGSVSTKRSGFDPAGRIDSPITAIGTTKRLISIR